MYGNCHLANLAWARDFPAMSMSHKHFSDKLCDSRDGQGRHEITRCGEFEVSFVP